jgi:hypothetical protein
MEEEKYLRSRLEKCHFQALRVAETRNRPLPALLEGLSAETDLGTLQRKGRCGVCCSYNWRFKTEIGDSLVNHFRTLAIV